MAQKLTEEKIKQQKAVNDASGKYKQTVDAGRSINKKLAAEMLRKGKK